MSSPNNAERKGRLISYVDAVLEALGQELDADPRTFIIGLNVDDHKGITGSTMGLYDRFGGDRVMDTPLSEDAVTGVSIGAAMAGLRPVQIHIRMDFLMLCMNQLVNMAAKAHYMYGGQVRVPMVVRAIIGKSWGQGAQHSQGLHSMFMHVPGLKVVAPTNAYDAKGLLIAAMRDDNPVIFVEHRMLYYTEAFVPEASYVLELGRAKVVRGGADITLVGVSNMLMECLRARELLSDSGIEAEVIDPVTLSPLDMETLISSAAKTGHLLVVDNGWVEAGASAEIVAGVVEGLSQNGAAAITARRMGFAPTTCPTTPALEDHFYPTAATIAATAHAMVRPEAAPLVLDDEMVRLAHELKFRGPF